MKANKQKRNQIFIAWLLLLALMPMNMVKGFHHHEERVAHDTEQKLPHSHDNCQICQFVLSPFLEAESVELTLIAFCVECQPTHYLVESNVSAIESYYLRGPPTANV